MEVLFMNNLRELRSNRGISLMELSKITGIPYRTLQDLELGNININNTGAAKLYKIAKALKVSMESLIDKDNL